MNPKPTRQELVDILAEADGQEIAAQDDLTKDAMYGSLAQAVLDRYFLSPCSDCGGYGYTFVALATGPYISSGALTSPCPKGCIAITTNVTSGVPR